MSHVNIGNFVFVPNSFSSLSMLWLVYFRARHSRNKARQNWWTFRYLEEFWPTFMCSNHRTCESQPFSCRRFILFNHVIHVLQPNDSCPSREFVNPKYVRTKGFANPKHLTTRSVVNPKYFPKRFNLTWWYSDTKSATKFRHQNIWRGRNYQWLWCSGPHGWKVLLFF